MWMAKYASKGKLDKRGALEGAWKGKALSM